MVHHLLTVVGAHSNCSDSHLFVLFLSARTTLILFSILLQMSCTLLYNNTRTKLIKFPQNEEKKTILAEYFNPNSSSVVGKKISAITEQGISKDDLYDLLNLVLKENYYTLLLGLDGEASLGNTQITYKLYDENGNLLNECGELEAAAYRYFVEE